MTHAIGCASFDDREEARSMADFEEVRMTIDEILARNQRWDFYRAERVRKGRPAIRTVYRQAEYRDGKPVRWIKTVSPDPMLDLYVARKNARNRLALHSQVRYGALRQTVVSPVTLPADPKPHSYVQAEGRVRDLEAA